MNPCSNVPEGRISTRHLLSAKGALFISSLGQRPRILEELSISAESAIHSRTNLRGIDPNPCVESRLQRLLTIRRKSWGAATGY